MRSGEAFQWRLRLSCVCVALGAMLAAAAVVPAMAQEGAASTNTCAAWVASAADDTRWSVIVVAATAGAGYAPGSRLDADTMLRLAAGEQVRICDRRGNPHVLSGPGSFPLAIYGGSSSASSGDPVPYDSGLGATPSSGSTWQGDSAGGPDPRYTTSQAEQAAAERYEMMRQQAEMTRERAARQAAYETAARQLRAAEAEAARQRAAQGASAMPSRPSPAKTTAPPRRPGSASPSRSRIGAVRGGGAAQLAPYPVWPPEAPSSRARLDSFIASRANLSLYDAGEKLIAAFGAAGYLEYSFYSAPGGFVLVTRIEKIGADGSTLQGADRYRLPNQRKDASLTEYIRNLFLEAPPGFYRYIAVVVTDQPYRASDRALGDSEAIRRLRGGSSDLTSAYKTMPFTDAYKVDALIYEFRKDSGDGSVTMIEPGRLPPNIHLARTGLDRAIRQVFAR